MPWSGLDRGDRPLHPGRALSCCSSLQCTSMFPCIYVSMYLFMSTSVNLSVYLYISLSTFLSICLSLYLSISIHLSIYVYIYIYIYICIVRLRGQTSPPGAYMELLLAARYPSDSASALTPCHARPIHIN